MIVILDAKLDPCTANTLLTSIPSSILRVRTVLGTREFSQNSVLFRVTEYSVSVANRLATSKFASGIQTLSGIKKQKVQTPAAFSSPA